jgi:mono/diheme cytochrome c family protein
MATHIEEGRAMKGKDIACLLIVAAQIVWANSALADAPGQKVFEARCNGCHFRDGFGTYTLAMKFGSPRADLTARTDLEPAYIRQVVRRGLINMPAQTRVEVTGADLDAIVAYLTRPRSAP